MESSITRNFSVNYPPLPRPSLHKFSRFQTLPKVHSGAEGRPLNLHESPVITLAMLSFFHLLVQQDIAIMCSHPYPLQHTSPQYERLDVHLTNMPQLQTRSSTLTKKPGSCAPFFHAKLLAKLVFVPCPWPSSYLRVNNVLNQGCLPQKVIGCFRRS